MIESKVKEKIPKIFWKDNPVTEQLNNVRYNSQKLSNNRGCVYGLMAIDQDAKIIAVDSKYDRTLNIFDLCSVGAALYGVARQGQDFFEANQLERATIIYDNMQLFVKSIGQVKVDEKKFREVLIILLTDEKVNIGILIFQMNRFAELIKKGVEAFKSIKDKLKMTEIEYKEEIKNWKNTLGRNKGVLEAD